MGHSSSWIADTTMTKFWISEQIIVTGAQVITVCWAVFMYEVTVTNSRLCNCILFDWTAIMKRDLWEGTGGLPDSKASVHTRAPHVTR